MEWDIILEIAEKAGLHGEFDFTTLSLAHKLQTSQQTISRKLIRLEKEGYITRKASNAGVGIELTEKGRKAIATLNSRLKKIFKEKTKVFGKVVKGLGEGKYYVKEYSSHFKAALNFKAYEGTINLRVNPIEFKKFISQISPKTIDGFEAKARRFGPVHCYKALINSYPCYIVRPERTTHPQNICEVIAQQDLKKSAGIKVGSKVTLSKSYL